MAKSFMFHFPQEKDKLAFNFPVYPVFYTIGNDPTLLTRSSGGTDIVANEPTESESFDGTVEGDLNFTTPEGQPRKESELNPEFVRQMKSEYSDISHHSFQDVTKYGELFLNIREGLIGELIFPGSGIQVLEYTNTLKVANNDFIKDVFDLDTLETTRTIGSAQISVATKQYGKSNLVDYDNISPQDGDMWYANDGFNFQQGGQTKVIGRADFDFSLTLNHSGSLNGVNEVSVGDYRTVDGVVPFTVPTNCTLQSYEVIVHDHIQQGSNTTRYKLMERDIVSPKGKVKQGDVDSVVVEDINWAYANRSDNYISVRGTLVGFNGHVFPLLTTNKEYWILIDGNLLNSDSNLTMNLNFVKGAYSN